MKITPGQLGQICPTLSSSRRGLLTTLINELCTQYGMNVDQFHEFIAQVCHESRGFEAKSEDLLFTTAARIHEVWPTRFPTVESAKPYIRDSQRLANKVYANRMGNGDEASGDGFKFRGGGFIQITGRDMYTKFARYKAADLSTIARLVRTEDRWALDSALWLFCIEKKLLDEAERDEFITITKAINGGTVGLEDRKKYYERAKAAVR